MSKEEQSPLIVPVTLQPIENSNQQNLSKHPSGLCTITLAHAEITFQNGVEERVIQRSIAGPTVLAKLIYDKFIQYLPLYRQVKEWERYGLLTNDKNLLNWVIRVAEDFLSPVYEFLKQLLTAKSLLHVDETYAQIINRSDGKSGQSNAYNWVFRSVPCQGPTTVLFHSSLSRSRSVLETFTADFKGVIICDGYSAYGNLLDITYANCWAHVRPYWHQVDSKQGQIGVDYCDQLYRLECKFKKLKTGKRRKHWLFSVNEAGAKANAICLSLVKTVKANGIDFYQYLVKLFTDLPNSPTTEYFKRLHASVQKYPSYMCKIAIFLKKLQGI